MSTTTSSISARLNALRERMAANDLAAYLITGTDPHMSEYVPLRWRTREWISGFTGSAGTVVVTADDAMLWVDFRYYIQAAEEIDDSQFSFLKLGEPGVKTPAEWLCATLNSGDKVGVNGSTQSVAAFDCLEKAVGGKEILVQAQSDLLNEIWPDRPDVPMATIRNVSDAIAGRGRETKLQDLRKAMDEKGADHHLISALDEIAWVLNLRGGDVTFTPVAVAHLLVTPDAAHLFVHEGKVPAALAAELNAAGVQLAPYDTVATGLANLPAGAVVLIDPQKTAIGLKRAIPGHCRIVDGASPVAAEKCKKNAVELSGIRTANLRDGVAMVRFLSWLDREVPTGGVTELTVADKLVELRGAQEHFLEPSFGTIAAYAEHGALCHYSATPESAHSLRSEGLFLVDSGGQYLDGTTDITRTVALGPLTAQQKRDFTLTLKCHITLATATFPEGTTGGQLEVLGKHAMWRERATYNHGPGHGIGHCLGVHEGPAGFGRGNPTPLAPGMVLTNEPGLYREGHYGIRIENTVVVAEDSENEFGKFLGFDTISFCPIDCRAVNADLLDSAEREWLNTYHQRTLSRLEGFLDDQDRTWLIAACKPI